MTARGGFIFESIGHSQISISQRAKPPPGDIFQYRIVNM
jgi:hypothetical protein